jgi:penicillin amidase
MIESYSAGVNAFIDDLNAKKLPLEYKLLDYQPEAWTTLKTALLLKLMADDLSGYCNDFAYTNAKKVFGKTLLDELYPDFQSYISPIIPIGTKYDFEAIQPDTIPYQNYETAEKGFAGIPAKPDYTVGSNNWAVGGSHTKSGYPILCGDPHLRLTLPSIWYQVQLTVNGKNVSGASLPGAPGVVIGFNDSCAWSMTNAERDVKNFYHIKFKDETQQEYWCDNQWKKTELKVEHIKVRGKTEVLDSVYYTAFGPVQYDKRNKLNGKIENLSVAWISHLPSNELLTIYNLNRANNFNEYDEAISHFQSPGQNFVFAAKNNDIAIWEQGRFPVLQEEEGKFILEGNNSNNFWHSFIPHEQNPHHLNPERGFVSSANQQPTDKTYPYNYYGDYYEYRSLRINSMLEKDTLASVESMKSLQNDNYNLWVEDFKLAISNYELRIGDGKFWNNLMSWNNNNLAKNESTTFFNLWYDALLKATFDDEFSQHNSKLEKPNRDVVIDIMKNDSNFVFWDNIKTKKKKETLKNLLVASFDSAYHQFKNLQKMGKSNWADYRNTVIENLAKIEPFSVKVNGNGEKNSVNAVSSTHGPSWRMVVSLTPQTEAYGIYPGGQSGNPGSFYYDNLIAKWDKGEYNKIEVLNSRDKALKQINFIPK